MATGKTHNTVTLTSGTVTGLVTATFLNTTIGLSLFVGHLLGLVLTPDIDVDNGSRANYHTRKLGLGFLFQIFFKPYAMAYKHRSNASHLPLFSTLWRLFYLLVPFIVLLNKNQPTSKLRLALYAVPAQFIAVLFWLPLFWLWLHGGVTAWLCVSYGVLGLVMSDTLHWIWDL